MSAEVEALLSKRAHPLSAVISALRKLILAADKKLIEEVKWNAPSYRLEDHLLTFQLSRDDRVLLIFHRGAKTKALAKRPVVADPSALLTWKGTDRAVAGFASVAEVTKHKPALTTLVRAWVALARSA